LVEILNQGHEWGQTLNCDLFFLFTIQGLTPLPHFHFFCDPLEEMVLRGLTSDYSFKSDSRRSREFKLFFDPKLWTPLTPSNIDS